MMGCEITENMTIKKKVTESMGGKQICVESRYIWIEAMMKMMTAITFQLENLLYKM